MKAKIAMDLNFIYVQFVNDRMFRFLVTLRNNFTAKCRQRIFELPTSLVNVVFNTFLYDNFDNRDFEDGNDLNSSSQTSDHKKVEREKSLSI